MFSPKKGLHWVIAYWWTNVSASCQSNGDEPMPVLHKSHINNFKLLHLILNFNLAVFSFGDYVNFVVMFCRSVQWSFDANGVFYDNTWGQYPCSKITCEGSE